MAIPDHESGRDGTETTFLIELKGTLVATDISVPMLLLNRLMASAEVEGICQLVGGVGEEEEDPLTQNGLNDWVAEERLLRPLGAKYPKPVSESCGCRVSLDRGDGCCLNCSKPATEGVAV